MKQNKWLSKCFLACVFTFLYLPIIFMIIYSFNSSKTIGNWTGFSLQWYEKLLQNSAIQQSLFFTIGIATSATFFSTILGVIAAIGLFYARPKTKRVLLSLNQIPLVSPDILIGVSTMLLFLLFNLPFGFITVLIAHIMFCTPIVVVSIMPRFYHMDLDIIAAAEDLGANTWQTLKVAIMPAIMPGIITGALMAFTFSLDDFVVTYFTAGEGVSTLSVQIYTQIRRQVSPELNALSTIMFGLILFIIIIYLLVTKKQSKQMTQTFK